MVMKMNELIIGTFCIGMIVGGVITWGMDYRYIKWKEKANDEFVESATEHYKTRVLNLEKEISRLIEERDAYRAKVDAIFDAMQCTIALKVSHDN